MEADYLIVLAQPEHLSELPEIERQAASLFRGWNVPAAVIEETTPLAEFQAAQAEDHLWVALSPQHHPVGFALTEPDGITLHLEEIDVHPRHGRRGVGKALVEAVCAWARDHGYIAITLTTYRDIPWNAPFYAKLGFEVLSAEELTAELRLRVDDEATRGLDSARRVVMRNEL
ncbi:MAG: GNAT family N-acetyltransferase [Deltaproteobacteria bacterium]|nr:GNAT family N-acetyltransferase [Deltaproteobacteria bacterium]